MSIQDEAVIEAVGLAICRSLQQQDGDHAKAAIRAYLSALDKAGFAVVPGDPTPKMMWTVERHHSLPTYSEDHRVSIYRAMVSASPPPPGADTLEAQR